MTDTKQADTDSDLEVDTSYWKVKDKQWMAEQKEQWDRVELMLEPYKSKKGKNIIKYYFLKGKMPNWDMLANWYDDDGHLDLFIFLWLHPSWDEEVLTSLRDAYMNSRDIVLRDLTKGFNILLRSSIIMLSQDCSNKDENHPGSADEPSPYVLYTGHHELLFKIMMGDLSQTSFTIAREDRENRVFEFPRPELFYIYHMASWLCVKQLFPAQNDMLMHFDQPLEWWYEGCPKDEDYFLKQSSINIARVEMKEALWRIYHFDTEKEGPSPRTTFVKKITKMLDERFFIKEIKEIWDDVKNGKVMVGLDFDCYKS